MPKMPMLKGGMTTVNRYIRREEIPRAVLERQKKEQKEFDQWYATLTEEEKLELEDKDHEKRSNTLSLSREKEGQKDKDI